MRVIRVCFGLLLGAAIGWPQGVKPKTVEASTMIAPKTGPVLTESAKQAVDLANGWNKGDGSAPVLIDKVGRVKYVYGAEMPTLVCSALRVCAIELEASESVVGDTQIGDSDRWSVSLLSYGGAAGVKTPVIAVSPLYKGAFETNLIVPTDRRMYYFRLQSKPDSYMARVSFSYPEDLAAKRKRELEAMAAPPPIEQAPVVIAAPINLEDLADKTLLKGNTSYSITGGKHTPCLKPEKVFDDSMRTVIQMPSCIESRSLPVLLVYGDGGEVQTNYRYNPERRQFIVDQLFQKAKLQAGTKKRSSSDCTE